MGKTSANVVDGDGWFMAMEAPVWVEASDGVQVIYIYLKSYVVVLGDLTAISQTPIRVDPGHFQSELISLAFGRLLSVYIGDWRYLVRWWW